MPPEEGTAAWRLRACPPDCRGAYRRIPGIDPRKVQIDPPPGGVRGYAGSACAGQSSSSWDRRRSWTGAGACGVPASRASRSELVALQQTGHARVRRLERRDRARPGRARPRRAAERRAEPAGRLGGRAGPAGRRLAARAGLGRRPGRPGAADGRRRAPPHELPERARDARGAAGLGRRADRQRERLDRDRRDHVRRQRCAGRAGRAAAARAPARAAHGRRRPLHARSARQGGRADAARCTTVRCSPSSTSTPPRRAVSAPAACARRSSPPRWPRAAASPA